MSKYSAYRADVDGLRAIAVSMVLIYHAFPHHFPSGFIGVDIFFVISGYLITGIIASAADQNKFSFLEFYVRRFRRILPALFVVFGACLVFGWSELLPVEFKNLGKHIVASGAFMANFIFMLEADYFDPGARTKPLLHLWSLGLEEQFYLIWPFLIIFMNRLKLNRLYWIALLIGLSFITNLLLMPNHSSTAFYMLPSRAWELLIGAWLALYENSHSPTNLPQRNLISTAGVILLLLSAVLIDKTSHFPGFWALLPSLGAGLIIFGGVDAWFNRRVLSLKPVVYIGLISYPLYLWHWPILIFSELTNRGTPALALLLSLFLSIVTYHFVEKPIKMRVSGWLWLRQQPRWLGGTGLAFSLIMGFAFLVYEKRGYVDRWPDSHGIVLNLIPDKKTDDGCLQMPGIPNGLTFCRMDARFDKPSVAIIGDSHAHQLFSGLSSQYKSKGQGVISLGIHSCPPFADSHYKNFYWKNGCSDLANEVVDFVIKSASIKTVVISFFLADLDFWDFRQNSAAQIAERLNKLITRISASGKKAVVIVDPPVAGVDLNRCFRRGIASAETIPNCQVDLQKVDQDLAQRAEIYSGISSEACVFDTIPLFRKADSFKLFNKDDLLYLDRNHISISGGAYVAAEFAKSKCF